MTYEGGEDATPRRVVRYLVANYDVDEATAKQLVADDANGELASGMRVGSMAYYVGDKLARAAKLVEREHDDDDDDDGDGDE